MSEAIILWAALALLVVLCLPIAALHKFVLEVCAWLLRLAMLALLAAGAYLWFRPEQLPTVIPQTLNDFPSLASRLPAPADRTFGITAAVLLVAVLIPVLAVLDVTRKLAVRRLRHLRLLAGSEAPVVATQPPASSTVPVGRPVDRRTAADALAASASNVPVRGESRARVR
jgi:hypothetical protein